MAFVIGVSGAQGVGKSTLCDDLTQRLRTMYPSLGVEVRGGVARSLKARGVSSDADTHEAEYALYFEKHLRNLLTPTDADVLILDRTFLDTLCFAEVNRNLAPEWTAFVEFLAAHILAGITYYFFIPVEFGIVDDGVRSTDGEYQLKLEGAISATLNRLRPEHYVLHGARSARVERVISIIAPSLG